MSSYQDTLDYLFNQFPQYQKIGFKAYKADLSNIQFLCESIDNPQNNFKTIHVAGTNGKGSVVHMLGSVLQHAGYKVGIFTSPHLVDFRERIKINGDLISRDFVVEFVQKYTPIFNKINPSFFEWSTCLAFHYFDNQKVDVAVIETGLGGRLDATNILLPKLSIITTIGKDHQNILGNSTEEIAVEKGGIIKENVPVVIGSQIKDEALIALQKIAKRKNSTIHFPHQTDLIDTDLKGDFQVYNSSIVSKAIELLKTHFQVNEDQLKSGLQNVVANTGLRGRWEILHSNPLTIADIGHNEQAVKFICKELEKINCKKKYVVLGFSEDKNIDNILRMLPKPYHYILTEATSTRAQSSELLNTKMKGYPNTIEIKNYKKAFLWAKSKATNEDLIFVGGSAFLVADILREFFPS